MVTRKKGNETRRRLLEVAFEVIRRKGFQAAGLGEILTAAGLTKGALYHHFRDKIHLGYAVIEEIVGEIIDERWIAPLPAGGDPLTVIPQAMRTAAEAMDDRDIELGCPLGNLSAEMSALDEGFAQRIDAIYEKWRNFLTELLSAGESVLDDDPERIAAFIVATLSGCLAHAKAARRRDILLYGITELEFYLNQIRAETSEPPAAKPPPAETAPESPEPEATYAPPPAEMEDYLL
ncbi:MAG: TetR/AcrR family transcriptional regulator [Phycisphaerae bacterium]|jgi:AcrR family transcriptional regulator|nr:TetR/AcrR family transcriptional regulator [Phycisphaerae bacterium]